MNRLLLLALLLVTVPAYAQSTDEAAGCEAPAWDTAVATVPAAAEPAVLTEAEQRVQDVIAGDGVHVVHFWAPWCPNSVAELRAGWYEVVERHPDVTFTFVTIWNDGESGRETLDRFGLPASVEEVMQADLGDSSDKSLRRKTFLGLPVTWIPSTWVFHNNGELAVAFNYGELEMSQIDQAIGMVQRSWSHSSSSTTSTSN